MKIIVDFEVKEIADLMNLSRLETKEIDVYKFIDRMKELAEKQILSNQK